jgi:predicted transcriptional regulator
VERYVPTCGNIDALRVATDAASEILLAQEGFEKRKTKVQEALVDLVAKGFVVEERMEDGRRVFGMNEEKREAITSMLAKK